MQFKEPNRKPKIISNDEPNKSVMNPENDFSLRKSKSYNGPDNKCCQNTVEDTNMSGKYQANEFFIKDLNCFPEDINNMAKRIVKGKYLVIYHIPVYNT